MEYIYLYFFLNVLKTALQGIRLTLEGNMYFTQKELIYPLIDGDAQKCKEHPSIFFLLLYHNTMLNKHVVQVSDADPS